MRNALSALTAITGSFIVMGAAASGAAAFYHSIIQEVQEPHHNIIQADIVLVRIFDTDTIHADITISAPKGPVSLGGAVSYTLLYDGNKTIHRDLPHHTSLLPDDNHVIIRYVGPLNMTKPVDVGDTIHIVINHRFGQDVIPVRVS